MLTFKRRLHYWMHHYPPRREWTFEVPITRLDAVKFCEGLALITEELEGAVITYPDADSGRNDCRFEWHVPLGNKKFWYRVGLVASVSGTDVQTKGYAAYGEAHPKKSAVPEFTEEEQDHLLRHLSDVIERTLGLVTTPSTAEGEPVYYVEIPPGCQFENPHHFRELDCKVFETVLFKPERRPASAIAPLVSAGPFKGHLRAAGLVRTMEFCAVATLATGALFDLFHPRWPNRHKPAEFLEDGMEKVYPKSRVVRTEWRWLASRGPERIDLLAPMVRKLAGNSRTKFFNSLFAYHVGMQLRSKHPTLATVCFLAALAPLGVRTVCDEKLTCPSHGPLTIRHDIIGERAAILELLSDLLALGPEAKDRLDRLLSRVHRKQRSGFVHNALLSHGEYQKVQMLSLPSDDGPVSELLQRRDDMRSLEEVTRWGLIGWCAREVKEPVPSEFQPDRDRVARSTTVLDARFTIPARTVVGMLQNPEGQDSTS